MLDDTHVPLAVVAEAAEELGYTINSLVQAMGGDRAVNEPLNEHWRPVYGPKTRWLPKTALGRISSDLNVRRGPRSQSKRSQGYIEAAEKYWRVNGGEAAKQAALAPNIPEYQK